MKVSNESVVEPRRLTTGEYQYFSGMRELHVLTIMWYENTMSGIEEDLELDFDYAIRQRRGSDGSIIEVPTSESMSVTHLDIVEDVDVIITPSFVVEMEALTDSIRSKVCVFSASVTQASFLISFNVCFIRMRPLNVHWTNYTFLRLRCQQSKTFP